MTPADYHPVIDILVRHFKVTSEALVPYQEQLFEKRNDVTALKEVLLKYKVVKESLFQEAVARFYDVEYRERFDDLNGIESFTKAIPIRYAKKFMFFPIKKDGFNLEVALEDPACMHPIDDVALKLKCRVIPVVSNREAILNLINQAYERASTTDAAIEELDIEGFDNIQDDETEDLIDAVDEEPVKHLVNSLLWQAVRENASDVHIDPTPREINVRYRIDGILYDLSTIPKKAHLTVVNRVKVMSRLDIAQKGMPQDGRTMVLIAGKKIDIRVSTIPTVQGEKVVMRLLYQSENLMQLKDLGLVNKVHTEFNRMIHKTGGIVLVTGPTGSGKTTTLYAALGSLDRRAKNVITIEDPVEYKIPGYSQIEVNPKLGLTFANALRSVLRQDPDVIMVGEMRDSETAQIAIQAALTGHLVFSTVHTNNAPATITRLIDMKVESFLVSSTIIGILAQRLVRRICKSCKKAYDPHEEQLREAGLTLRELKDAGVELYRGSGCEHCRDTGYHGRMGIHELLIMDDRIKRVILENKDEHTIKRVAMSGGMTTLRQDGAYKALLGITTLEEVLSVTREN